MTQHNAVTFDPAAFRNWLEYRTQPTDIQSPTQRDANPLLASAYQRLDGEAGWLVETTLPSLHDATAHQLPADSQAWRYADGVDSVTVWATADPEGGPDGGLVGEVTVDGVTLSLGRLTDVDLIPAEHTVLPGYEAAEYALTAVADAVNAVAGKYRSTGFPAGWVFDSLSNADIEAALTTLAELHHFGSGTDLSQRQVEVMEKIAQLVPVFDTAAGGGEVVDGEIVDEPAPGNYDGQPTAYQAAAAAVDNDYNHSGHPDHW